jgi:hypothetical protein
MLVEGSCINLRSILEWCNYFGSKATGPTSLVRVTRHGRATFSCAGWLRRVVRGLASSCSYRRKLYFLRCWRRCRLALVERRRYVSFWIWGTTM